MKKKIIIIISSIVTFLLIAVIVWIEVGIHVEWGPFKFLAFDKRESEIIQTYDADERKKEIVFYGASNFRLWKEMEEDMKPFVVQNHGFGGSTDKDLIERADTLLYPYDPSIVVFQTGSNDYPNQKGNEEEILTKVIEQKKAMYLEFHNKLPKAKFAVISGILMPGRKQYDEIVMQVNAFLRSYCSEIDYMYFIDAEDMTIDQNGNHIESMFIKDGIHLTHDARIKWADEYIKPVLEDIVSNQ